MKTLTTPTTTDSSPSQNRVQTASPRKPVASAGRSQRPLHHLAVAGVVLSLAALGACTSDTSPSPSGTPGATSPATSTSVPMSTTATTTTPTTAATAARAIKTVKVTIKDDVLGHVITATKLSRSIPWPAGNPVAAASFEIVGVNLTVDAGDRYSADVKASMFTLKPGAAAPITPTTEFGKKFGTPLETTKRAQKKSGWLFFKVDRGSSGAFQLILNRPAYTVKTTGKSIKAATFAKPIG